MTPQAERLPGILPTNPDELSVDTHRIALVHVLTAQFQGLNPLDFEDISPEVIERAAPDNLRAMLINVKPDGQSAVSYHPAEEGTRLEYLAVTPKEFNIIFRSIRMLANSAYTGVLATRDAKLQQETGKPAAKARSEEDLRTAYRAAVRQVISKMEHTEKYLSQDILPRIELVDKFLEMVRNPNLVRGTDASVRERFEHLRDFVFADMLDAIGNQKRWTPEQASRAERIIQKRLYLEPNALKRRQNFVDMLYLAEEYYGANRALVLGRIAEAQHYLRSHSDAYEDVKRIDAERAQASEA